MDDQPPVGNTPDEADLDAPAAAMLAAFRDEEQIPGALHERVWDRVEVDIAAASSATVVAGPWVKRLVVGALSVAAAVALVWVSADAMQAEQGSSTSGQASYEARTPSESGVAQPRAAEAASDAAHRRTQAPNVTPEAPESVTPESEALELGTLEPPAAEPESPTSERAGPNAAEPAAAEPPAATPGTTSTSRRPTPRRSQPAAPTPQPQPETKLSTLGQEIALIERARKALLAHAPGQAIQILREHADKFPKGAMAQERRALHAIAGCERDGAAGESRAQRFLSDHPTAALAERVRKACEIH